MIRFVFGFILLCMLASVAEATAKYVNTWLTVQTKQLENK